ncbi:MAG TPA: lipase family protein [Variovorax sp.]
MASIPYDASRAALYTPERHETLFAPDQTHTPTQWAVEAARLTYYRAEESAAESARLDAALALAGFGAPTLFRDGATLAFGSLHAGDGSALVAFRGTQPDEIRHLVTNLQAQQTEWTESGGRVHAGFSKAVRSVLPQITEWLAGEARQHSRLILAGHSLGAALATLAATVLDPALLVTLGSPRVGDAEFVAALADCHVIRLVDGCDIVTQLPPALSFYAHAGAVTYITCVDAACIDDPSPSLMEADRSKGRALYAAEHAWKPGSVLLRDLADHAPINYARAYFVSPPGFAHFV